MKKEVPTFKYANEREIQIYQDALKAGEAFNYENRWLMKYSENRAQNTIVGSLRIVTLNDESPLITGQSNPVRKDRYNDHRMTSVPIPGKGPMPRARFSDCQVNFHWGEKDGERILKLVFSKKPDSFEKTEGESMEDLIKQLVSANIAA